MSTTQTEFKLSCLAFSKRTTWIWSYRFHGRAYLSLFVYTFFYYKDSLLGHCKYHKQINMFQFIMNVSHLFSIKNNTELHKLTFVKHINNQCKGKSTITDKLRRKGLYGILAINASCNCLIFEMAYLWLFVKHKSAD